MSSFFRNLGVAFEQGKLLPTPETIPFRLTRDIVDGMGIVGIEGLFRSTCEKTLDVMRKSEEVIATIVEVSFIAGHALAYIVGVSLVHLK